MPTRAVRKKRELRERERERERPGFSQQSISNSGFRV
jgi:hypothetical protein